MIRMQGIAWLALLIASGTTVLASADMGIFRDLTLDKARQAATEGRKKLVLVDFYTVWCGPCKRLDETTWKDQNVKDWLDKEAVCLKVDAEKNEPLAEKYRINAYPTILLLRPDGTEVDRLVGYRDAKAFLADAGEALAGNDSLSRARKQLEGPSANDPMLRMAYGDALAQKGRAEDALSEYFWCFDHGLEHGPAFVGVRVSFLLSKILQLAQANPAALDELRKRRDAAAKAIEAGNGDFSKAMDLTALNSNLGEQDRTLAVYDKIKGDKAQPAPILKYLLNQSLDQLLAAKRYKEVIADADAPAEVRLLIDNHERMKAHMPDNAGLRDFMKQQVCLGGAKYYEALLGAGDKKEAAEVARMLEGFDPIGAFPPLIAAAKRAGDDKAAEALTSQAEKAGKKAEPRP